MNSDLPGNDTSVPSELSLVRLLRLFSAVIEPSSTNTTKDSKLQLSFHVWNFWSTCGWRLARYWSYGFTIIPPGNVPRSVQREKRVNLLSHQQEEKTRAWAHGSNGFQKKTTTKKIRLLRLRFRLALVDRTSCPSCSKYAFDSASWQSCCHFSWWFVLITTCLKVKAARVNSRGKILFILYFTFTFNSTSYGKIKQLWKQLWIIMLTAYVLHRYIAMDYSPVKSSKLWKLLAWLSSIVVSQILLMEPVLCPQSFTGPLARRAKHAFTCERRDAKHAESQVIIVNRSQRQARTAIQLDCNSEKYNLTNGMTPK